MDIFTYHPDCTYIVDVYVHNLLFYVAIPWSSYLYGRCLSSFAVHIVCRNWTLYISPIVCMLYRLLYVYYIVCLSFVEIKHYNKCLLLKSINSKLTHTHKQRDGKQRGVTARLRLYVIRTPAALHSECVSYERNFGTSGSFS